MPTKRSPRRGTLQYWHRQRAARLTARVRQWAKLKEAKALGFAAYKVGMSHVLALDNRPSSPTKGEEVFLPVTVLECPPLKVFGAVFYKKDENGYGSRVLTQVNAPGIEKDKYLGRVLRMPKTQRSKLEDVEKKLDELVDVRLLCATQPKLIGLKKKPEIIELGIGGGIKEKLAYAKSILGKEINAKDVFVEGQLIDVHSITKGKGYQGPVKRFGVQRLSHKSQKTIRGPGTVGPWTGNRSWTVPHAGQMGFHQRLERNKLLLKLGSKVDEINPAGGFLRYGFVRNNYLLVMGSVPGPCKRLITLTQPTRPNTKAKGSFTITYTSLASKQ
ncbi:MAG: 50S ribosomal protein L3 [Candidatus Woesearchaeota archaeon]